MIKTTVKKQRPLLRRIDVAEQRQVLLELKAKAKAQSLKRMIDLAITGLETGVPRLTPEEIRDCLDRDG
jgi:hypothetical protein